MNVAVDKTTYFLKGPSLMTFVKSIGDYPALLFNKFMKEYGDLVKCPLNIYLVSDPDIAKSILNRDQKDFNQDDFISKRIKTVFGLGLVTSQGKMWAGQRKVMNPLYSSDAVQNHIPCAIQEIDKVLSRWAHYAETQETFDLVNEMEDIAIMTSGKIQFDTDFQDDLGEIKKYARIGTPYIADGLPFYIPYWIPTPAHIRLRLVDRGVKRIFRKIIKERRNSNIEKKDLAGVLMAALDNDRTNKVNQRLMLDEMKTMMIGGYFPIACSLSMFWYVIGQNPGYMEHLYDEIQNIPGDYNFGSHFYKDFPITTKVIFESMRLYPVAFSIWRKSKYDQKVNGLFIPKGADICISIYNINRNPKIWNAPDTFNPDRFDSAQSADRPKHHFMPFGWGSRKCIGDHYAMLLIYLTIIRIIQQFKITILPNQKLKLKKAPLMSPRTLYAKVQLK